MAFRRSSVVLFAQDRGLDVRGITERADAAVAEYKDGSGDYFRARELEKVMGNKEDAVAYERAREQNSARYGH